MAKANSSIAPNTPVTLSPVAMVRNDHTGTGKGTIVKRVKGGYHVQIMEPNPMHSCPNCKGTRIHQNRTTKEFRCIDCIGDEEGHGGFTAKVVYVKPDQIKVTN